jgi:hypothetical protein
LRSVVCFSIEDFSIVPLLTLAKFGVSQLCRY